MELVRKAHGVAVSRPGHDDLPIGHIMGIGRNYAEHAHEQGLEAPERPMVFTKSPASACLSGERIVIPSCCQDREQVDFEGELGVIIGRAVKDVSADEVADPTNGIVLGYVAGNDVSARWWQKKGSAGQFCRGKSFDTFCPLSTTVASPDSVGDPSGLVIRTIVSGEVMQEGPTSAMIFPVPTLIAELSRGTTLAPGTLILTGTPSGVGMSRDPQRFLREGDTVEVIVGTESRPDLVGHLRNSVELERAEARV